MTRFRADVNDGPPASYTRKCVCPDCGSVRFHNPKSTKNMASDRCGSCAARVRYWARQQKVAAE